MEETITLHANRSGRLWTEDPDAWARLCSPAGCPICSNPTPPDAPTPDWILAETPILWVTADEDATLPGYACVCCKQHAVEPYELSPQAQAEFWPGDVYVGYVIHSRARFTRSPEQLQAMRAGIRARLAEHDRLLK